MKESMQYLFFGMWVILLNKTFFGYVQVPVNDVIFLLSFTNFLQSISK